MKLNDYFTKFESIDFDKLLAKFKKTFSIEDLNDEHMNVQAKLDQLITKNNAPVKINIKLNNIVKGNSEHFREFVSAEDRLEQYANCRALKTVQDVQKLITKAYDKKEEEQIQARKEVNSITTNTDTNWHKYYAVCNNLDGSNIQALPSFIIEKLGHYIDGNIDMQ